MGAAPARGVTAVRARDVLLLAVALALGLAWPLRSPVIGLHGEAREGLVVQTIVRDGEWVLPRRNGELPSKPPLFHWMAASVARVAGLSDVTLRVPSAVGVFAMATATLALGTAIGGRATGWLAVGVLFGAPSVWLSASQARVDMVFAAAVTLALAGFFLAWRGGTRGARVLFWLGTAAAVLAKGPAGAALVGLTIAGFLAVGRERPRLRAVWSWPLAALAGLVAVGWYVLAYREAGADFIRLHILFENVDRFVGRHHFGVVRHKHPPLRLVLALAVHLVPWNLVLLWSAVRWWRGEREDAAGHFLHAWWLTVLAVFSLAAGKRDVYLLPLYPAVALLAGRALAVAAAEPRPFGRVPVPSWVARRVPARPALAWLAGLLVFVDAGVGAVNQVWREHREARHSLAPFAAEVARRVGPADRLVATQDVYDVDLMVVAYRLDRPIPRAPLACPSEGFALVGARPPGDGVAVLARGVSRDRRIALVRCAGELRGRRP
ncbi:MAG TPA: glycosyltransferase family 39 protein [Candidatus Binatia bacterium]|nr:glycosyltransferase family 39 protein [Candidatus Binatia bacterium]